MTTSAMRRLGGLLVTAIVVAGLSACGGGSKISGIDIGGHWNWSNDYATGNDTDFEMQISGGASGVWTGNVNGDLSTLTTSGNQVNWDFNANDGHIVATGFFTAADNGRMVGNGTKTSGATVRNFTFSAVRTN